MGDSDDGTVSWGYMSVFLPSQLEFYYAGWNSGRVGVSQLPEMQIAQRFRTHIPELGSLDLHITMTLGVCVLIEKLWGNN